MDTVFFSDLPLGQYFWYGNNGPDKYLWCKIAEDGRSLLVYETNPIMIRCDMPRSAGRNRFERTHGRLVYHETAIHHWLNGMPLDNEEKGIAYYNVSPKIKNSFLEIFLPEELDGLQTMHCQLEVPKGYTRTYGNLFEFDARVVLPDVRELLENSSDMLHDNNIASVTPCSIANVTKIKQDSQRTKHNVFQNGNFPVSYRNSNATGFIRTSYYNASNYDILGGSLKPDRPIYFHPMIRIADDAEFVDITDTYSTYDFQKACATKKVMVSAAALKDYEAVNDYLNSIVLFSA